MVRSTGSNGGSHSDAVYMAAAAPAEAIVLGDRKGKIRAGYDADLVILDQRLQPWQVFIAGKKVLPGFGR